MSQVHDAIHVLRQFRDAVQELMSDKDSDGCELDYLVWDEHINDKLAQFDIPTLIPYNQFHGAVSEDESVVWIYHYTRPGESVGLFVDKVDPCYDEAWDAVRNEDWNKLGELIHGHNRMMWFTYHRE